MGLHMAPSEDEKGERAILTTREREIIRGEADVSDNYYYRVVSRVRDKISRVEGDLEILEQNHPELANELHEAVCGTGANDG